MRLDLYRHLWGVDEAWETVFPKITALGFVGIETGIPAEDQRGRFRALLDQHRLGYLAMVFSGGPTVEDHLQSFRRQLQAAIALGAAQITAHTGRDSWSAADVRRFYAEIARIEADCPIAIGHETHRGRCLFNPWATRDLLLEHPWMRLTCDFSHWVVVCERLFEEDGIVRLCGERALHIHARVGYENGPQVADPSAPEYARHLAAHERWWDLVWDAQQARGMAATTLTPEFGPPTYLHTLPHTNVPVADLWTVCTWVAQRQGERFARRGTAAATAAGR